MKKFILIAVACCTLLFSFRQGSEKQSVQSVLKTATVYRAGASLMHTATATLDAGDNELVIEGISSYLDINSIQINCPAEVTILGSEFSNNYLTPENASPAILAFKDSLESINRQTEKLNVEIATDNELLEVLNTNKDLKGTQTGVSVTELAKLMIYYKAQALDVKNELLVLNRKRIKLQELSGKISQQISEEQSRNTVSGGRVSLQLNVALQGKYEFTVSYITQNAFWTPYYDVRADNIKSPLKFIYKAKVSQTTGIDWKKVKLSLSTSLPKQFGTAPVFKTWFMGYLDPVTGMNKDLDKGKPLALYQDSYEKVQPAASGIFDNAMIRIRGIRSLTGSNDPMLIVNGTPMPLSSLGKIPPENIKSQSILKGSTAAAIYGPEAANGVIVIMLKEGLDDYVTVTENELDLTYDIELPYDVPTTGKQQIAVLQETTVPATYKYYAVPKLDKDVFLLAEVANWQTLNLLPGEANIIFEGTYIGQSFIDPSNTADTLNLTLGTDKRVVVTKEKVKDYSSVKFFGTNKLQTITYDLTVKNNKKEPIHIALKDQYPKSTQKEIEVNLLESSGAVITDEIGVVTWQLDIEPGQSKKLRISYSIKYPKDKTVNLN